MGDVSRAQFLLQPSPKELQLRITRLKTNHRCVENGDHAGRREVITTRAGKFNPEDACRVKHTRIGAWDLYEDRQTDMLCIPGSSRLETYDQCWLLLSVFLVVKVLASLTPAVSLWYA
ncbi:hypothetical protein BDR03DRAFT_963243 [Suillus americanus]|nr:hypothetical protein BDR03DRAFT_963243 [Suillus americanus]